MAGNFSAPESDHEKFLYSVSHDLQEPLRMISSFLQLIEVKAGQELSEEVRNYLNQSKANAARMKQMINALVDLSRINRDTEPPESVDLRVLADEIASLFKLRSTTPFSFHGDCGLSARMAPNQAVVLMRVLIENAFDNAHPERPLELSFSCSLASGGYAEYRLADNGQGLPEQHANHVFDVFRQVKRNPERLGVGLTLAKAIVHRYNGNISLSATEGEGCVVTFTLPVAEA
jgi:chemotaxis family two-component system sensor kinase Cph1